MKSEKPDSHLLVAACGFVLMAAGAAIAQDPYGTATPATATAASAAAASDATAIKHVNDANAVVQKMLQETHMKEVLRQAKGVFIMPTYGKAALGVGASGGAGVLLVKLPDGMWSDPAFYNSGGISAGVQVGAEGGAVALVLNNDKAVNKFMQKNVFSLNANAGLTVVNWSKVAEGTLGDGDVIAWTDTKGLYGNLVSVGVTDIRYNQKMTSAYYHQPITVADALAGKHTNANADTLKQTLAAGPAPASR
jgi:lipid-binding SYLF domain-containing protein